MLISSFRGTNTAQTPHERPAMEQSPEEVEVKPEEEEEEVEVEVEVNQKNQ